MLFKKKQAITIFPGFSLEGIPNRDATAYMKEYKIENEVKTMFRGTLRYTVRCTIREILRLCRAFAKFSMLSLILASWMTHQSLT